MKSEAMWDRLAKDWDTPGASLGENDRRILEKAQAYLHASDIVLDFGCATGSIAMELAGAVQAAHGIDLSAKMIEIARRRASERGLKNTTFTHTTLFDESLQAAAFDMVLALNVLHLVDDPSQVMARLNHVLKPGGLFISATPCLGEKTWLSLLLNVPVFLASKVGILPHINFFGVTGLVTAITKGNFQLIESENLAVRPITERLVVARKLSN